MAPKIVNTVWVILAVTLAATGVALAAQLDAGAPSGQERLSSTDSAAGNRAVSLVVPITLDELKSMIQRRQMPRVSVTNRFGGVTVGTARGIEENKLLIDVAAESIGVSGTTGVPFSSILSVKVLVTKTPGEVARIREASVSYMAELQGRGPAAPPAGEALLSTASEVAAAAVSTDSSVSPAAAAEGAGEEVTDLLEMYPPKDGWGPKRLGEIVRKSVVLGLYPIGKEKTFVKDYDGWKAAYENKRNAQLEEFAAMQGMGTPIPADYEVLPELEDVPALEGAPTSSVPDAPVGDDSNGATSAPAGD